MLGNTFGRLFRVTCSGESYGRGLLTIVDGVPAGMTITREMIQAELDSAGPARVRSIHLARKLLRGKSFRVCLKASPPAHRLVW